MVVFVSGICLHRCFQPYSWLVSVLIHITSFQQLSRHLTGTQKLSDKHLSHHTCAWTHMCAEEVFWTWSLLHFHSKLWEFQFPNQLMCLSLIFISSNLTGMRWCLFVILILIATMIYDVEQVDDHVYLQLVLAHATLWKILICSVFIYLFIF